MKTSCFFQGLVLFLTICARSALSQERIDHTHTIYPFIISSGDYNLCEKIDRQKLSLTLDALSNYYSNLTKGVIQIDVSVPEACVKLQDINLQDIYKGVNRPGEYDDLLRKLVKPLLPKYPWVFNKAKDLLDKSKWKKFYDKQLNKIYGAKKVPLILLPDNKFTGYEWGGHASFGYNLIVLPENSLMKTSLIHEFGHYALDLGHCAGAVQIKDKVLFNEYGNSCIMASSKDLSRFQNFLTNPEEYICPIHLDMIRGVSSGLNRYVFKHLDDSSTVKILNEFRDDELNRGLEELKVESNSSYSLVDMRESFKTNLYDLSRVTVEIRNIKLKKSISNSSCQREFGENCFSFMGDLNFNHSGRLANALFVEQLAKSQKQGVYNLAKPVNRILYLSPSKTSCFELHRQPYRTYLAGLFVDRPSDFIVSICVDRSRGVYDLRAGIQTYEKS